MTDDVQPASRPTAEFKKRLLAEIPSLRAFAVSLCRSPHLADDLVQDTLLKAWSNASSFTEGTNMRAWLFTIIRNAYYSFYRKRGREVQDPDGVHAANLAVAPGQESAVDMSDFRAALALLSDEHREVLIMVGASGLSYEEAAQICGVAVGTIKSRLNRARQNLGNILHVPVRRDGNPEQPPRSARDLTADGSQADRRRHDGEGERHLHAQAFAIDR